MLQRELAHHRPLDLEQCQPIVCISATPATAAEAADVPLDGLARRSGQETAGGTPSPTQRDQTSAASVAPLMAPGPASPSPAPAVRPQGSRHHPTQHGEPPTLARRLRSAARGVGLVGALLAALVPVVLGRAAPAALAQRGALLAVVFGLGAQWRAGSGPALPICRAATVLVTAENTGRLSQNAALPCSRSEEKTTITTERQTFCSYLF